MSDILPLVTAFSFCFLVIRFAQPFAIRAGLVDIPCSRKKHEGRVPLIGGVAIYIGVLISSLFFFEYSYQYKVYLALASFILVLGVLDDKFSLSVRLRVVAQILIGLVMIYEGELVLSSFGYIFGFFELNLGVAGNIVTVIAVIAAINAFNMVDGIDGLAGVLSMVAFAGLAIMLSAVNSHWYLLPVLFIAAIVAFLLFNLRWPKKSMNKVFMGDAGSMLIGLTMVWLLIIGTDPDVQAFKPVTALYLIAVPLMDMVAIMYRRVKKGVSPFKPDREHLHHIFERAGYTRKQSLIRIASMSICLASLGCFLDSIDTPDWIMFSIFILIFSVYIYSLLHVWRILSWLRKH
ncbi:UDP-GlcNAc:undecaprenyl-phosphate GlcNAc-1-phosphate transferase [Pseudoalteromonas rubra]|uniref:Undecaprenyl-phosphate alpha-N-acetylglucosaminyl 1-phosphate transferase n=1 Tax=Pseudoalteromonas rubra TaxID=43658 RepID=A0A8T0CE98_9GAMM|nr:UDP-N-acetylglucosamine--undecaprenyl-phosphate N-acetylglucosaminephosphotransferase [Pseudoalteromonas rubra]KAF7788311.1 UDP-GlcNAc:undecaprenyl-phosphate GlcNAc-1-phosphate transferase [Pseudoalteromonas rubra]